MLWNELILVPVSSVQSNGNLRTGNKLVLADLLLAGVVCETQMQDWSGEHT